MRQNTRKQTNYSHERTEDFKTNYYIDGNTVRRLEGEPEERRRRQQEKEEEQKKRRHRHAAKRNRERAQRMNFGHVLFCSMALLLIGGVCVTYIQLQSGITSRTKSISALESEIADLRADNDAALKRIDLSTDLDAVKERAMGLGMKFPSPEQIVYYSVEEHDFMDQHSDIPEK